MFWRKKSDENKDSGDVSTSENMELNRVDEAYETKMAAFEVDCNDGKGEPIACHHVGEFFSTVREEKERAAKVYEKNCYEKGYAPSCFNLGRHYLSGKGVPQSDDKAEELFGKACDSKHLQACYHKAIMLYNTFDDVLKTGTDSNKQEKQYVLNKEKQQESLKLFDLSCKEGEYESCYSIGTHYLSKHNTTDRNPAMSVEYLTRACRSNHAPSCYNLAVLYRFGDTGVEKNEEEFEKFKTITEKLVHQFGGLSGRKAV